MRKNKNKYKSEFLITSNKGFQYIINDELRNMINDGNFDKIELERWEQKAGLDIVIEMRTELKEIK